MELLSSPGPPAGGGRKKKNGGVAAPVPHFKPRSPSQLRKGVFSAKYSWLSALSRALVGLEVARLLQAVCP
jgi:hypothetical protein